ncbi:hypothetical protein TNCV_2707601 [Trichonephila clavipes]|nr:hypothetical protein TNCV_2707601 [Trichonephila clavipes]
MKRVIKKHRRRYNKKGERYSFEIDQLVPSKVQMATIRRPMRCDKETARGEIDLILQPIDILSFYPNREHN